NADPGAEDSVVASFDVAGGLAKLPEVLQGRWNSKNVTLAEARLNDGQRLLAFNDLFIGQTGHTSARYRIEFGGSSEDQSSSGIIVSTGAGSTGWMRSVFVGAHGIVGNGHSRDDDSTGFPGSSFDWSADELVFAVREPWPSRTTGTSVVAGRIPRGQTLRVVSRMPKDGVVFSDGVPEDAVAFNSGAVAEVRQSKKKARLVAR
ncbi:MAG TPA: sugar kinase, partial [Thermoplasmata archaeon]|nr:sugar kinase [Thermoplasmata archaeon]